jgi:hypothetical protein
MVIAIIPAHTRGIIFSVFIFFSSTVKCALLGAKFFGFAPPDRRYWVKKTLRAHSSLTIRADLHVCMPNRPQFAKKRAINTLAAQKTPLNPQRTEKNKKFSREFP